MAPNLGAPPTPFEELDALSPEWLPSWLAGAQNTSELADSPASGASRAERGCAAAEGGLNLDLSYIRCTGHPPTREIDSPGAQKGGGSWYVQQKTVDTYAEFVAIHDPECDLQRGHGSKKDTPASQGPSADVEINFDDLFRKNEVAARRSKRGLKWAVLGLGADRIFTLTKRGRIESYAEAWALWSKFEQACSRRFANFKAVAVVEPHTLNGFHVHFVVNRYFDVSSMRLWWHRILSGNHKLRGILRGADSPGNVEAGKPHGTRKIAKYLAKYLGKSFEGLQAVRIKRYAASKGIRPATVVRTRMPSSSGAEVYHLRRRVEADGWKVEAIFEGSVMGRPLIWMQCSRRNVR
jgi:hypothetical protein